MIIVVYLLYLSTLVSIILKKVMFNNSIKYKQNKQLPLRPHLKSLNIKTTADTGNLAPGLGQALLIIRSPTAIHI